MFEVYCILQWSEYRRVIYNSPLRDIVVELRILLQNQDAVSMLTLDFILYQLLMLIKCIHPVKICRYTPHSPHEKLIPTTWLWTPAPVNKSLLRKIWDFHSGEDSSRGLLGCETMWCCGRIPMLPPQAGSTDCQTTPFLTAYWLVASAASLHSRHISIYTLFFPIASLFTLKLEIARSSKMTVFYLDITQHYNPEDPSMKSLPMWMWILSLNCNIQEMYH